MIGCERKKGLNMKGMKSRSLHRKPLDTLSDTLSVALNFVMRAVARRDHSETELRNKLQERFTTRCVDAALQYAHDHRWIPDPQDLANRTAETLRRRGKGRRYIQNYLHKKGLPPVEHDAEQELEKALELVKNKLSMCKSETIDRSTKEKMGRFLLARGFEMSLVRKVIYEKL